MTHRLEQRLLKDALVKTATSQSAIATSSGVSRPNISSYLSGSRRPSVTTLARLLDAMELDAEIYMLRATGEVVRSVRLSQVANECERSTVLDDLTSPLLVFGLRLEARLV